MRTQVKGADQHTQIEGIEVDVTNVRGSGAGRGVIDLGRMALVGEQSLELGFGIAAMKESGAVMMRTTRRPGRPRRSRAGRPARAERRREVGDPRQARRARASQARRTPRRRRIRGGH